MKELLAILVGLFTSMFNSLEYKEAEYKVYNKSAYYTIEEAVAPDYRSFYGAQYSASNNNGCKTTNYYSNGKKVIYPGTSDVENKGYWLVNDTTMELDTIVDEKTYTFDNESYIIMPFDGTLHTDSTTNDGKSMTIICQMDDHISYRIVISKMKCWYCDVGRDLTSTTLYHTSDNQKGKSFKAGHVLGMSIPGETYIEVTLLRDGTAEDGLTLKKMYENFQGATNVTM